MVEKIVFVVRERAVCSKNSALLLLNEFQKSLLLLVYWHAFSRVKKNKSCLIIAKFQLLIYWSEIIFKSMNHKSQVRLSYFLYVDVPSSSGGSFVAVHRLRAG